MEERCPCAGGTLDKLLQPAILAVLSEKSAHGYEILKLLARMPMFREQRPDATGLYRSLKEMERRGLIASAVATSPKGPAVRVYHVTPLGYSCLLRWMHTLDDHRRALGSLLSRTRRSVKRNEAAGRFGDVLPECQGASVDDKNTVRESAVSNESEEALIFPMGLHKAVLPQRLLYARSHFWFDVSADGSKTRCGLTAYAIRLLSDLFRIEWHVREGQAVAVGELLGEVESVKAVSELYAPTAGELLRVNAAVAAEPSQVNLDPYNAWLLEFSGRPEGAMQAVQYVQFLESEWENTAKLFKGQAH